MHRPTRLKVTDLNPHFTCVLCDGYFVDATTIVECLHSFCRACIVKYLETSRFCPVCDVQVHKTKPLLSIRSDKTLQDVVYKLVPGLYQNEMKRRREFYAEHPEAASRCTSEERGEAINPRCIYAPDERISLSLEYSLLDDDKNENTDESSESKEPQRRYLECPATLTVNHLKKFIRGKFSIPSTYKVEILYADDILEDYCTLLDIAYSYEWKRSGPMKFFYYITKCAPKRTKMPPSTQESEKTSSQESDVKVPSSAESLNSNSLSAQCNSPEQTLLLNSETRTSTDNECMPPPCKKLASSTEGESSPVAVPVVSTQSSTTELSSCVRTSESEEKSFEPEVSVTVSSPLKHIKELAVERLPYTATESPFTTSIVAHTVNSTAVSALNHNKPMALPVYSTVCVKTIVPCAATVTSTQTTTTKKSGKSRAKNRCRPNKLARLAPLPPNPFKGKSNLVNSSTAPIACFASPTTAACFTTTPVTCLNSMPVRCLAPVPCIGISPCVSSASQTTASVNAICTSNSIIVGAQQPSVTFSTAVTVCNNTAVQSQCSAVSTSNFTPHTVPRLISASGPNLSSLPTTSFSPLLATALSPSVSHVSHLSANTNSTGGTPLMPAVGTAPKAVPTDPSTTNAVQQPTSSKNIFSETGAAALPAVSIAALPTETTCVEQERDITTSNLATTTQSSLVSCTSTTAESHSTVSATVTTSSFSMPKFSVAVSSSSSSDTYSSGLSININKPVPNNTCNENCTLPAVSNACSSSSTSVNVSEQKLTFDSCNTNKNLMILSESVNNFESKNINEKSQISKDNTELLDTVSLSTVPMKKESLNAPFKTVKSSITAEFSDTDDLGCQPDLVVDEQKIDSSDNEDDNDDALRRKITAIAEKDDEADDTDSGRASDISNQARSSGDDDLGSPVTTVLTPDVNVASVGLKTQTSLPSVSATAPHKPEENSISHRLPKLNSDQTLDHIINNLHRQHEKKDNIGALDLSTSCRKPGQEPSSRPRQRPVANPPVLDAKHRQQTCLPAPTKQHTACVPAPKNPTSSFHLGAMSAARHAMIMPPISHQNNRLSPMMNSQFNYAVPLVPPHPSPPSVRCPDMSNSNQGKSHLIPSPPHGKSSPLMNSVHSKLCPSNSHHCPVSNSQNNTKSALGFRSHHKKPSTVNGRDNVPTTASLPICQNAVSPLSTSSLSPHHRLSPSATSPKVSTPSPSCTPHLSCAPPVSSTPNYKIAQPSFPIYKKDSYKNANRFKGSNLTVINPDPNGFRKIVIKNLDPKPNNHHHHHHHHHHQKV